MCFIFTKQKTPTQDGYYTTYSIIANTVQYEHTHTHNWDSENLHTHTHSRRL